MALNASTGNFDIAQVTSPAKRIKLTKTVCTAGPASWDEAGLSGLVGSGMNTMRMNFSHGDHETHARTMRRLQKVVGERGGPFDHVAVMLDTKGPEIRTGMLENGENIRLVKDSTIELTTDYSFLGNPSKLACSYADLPSTVQPGSKILIADGAVTLEVKECLESSVMCTVLNDAEIGERKNMNLPGAVITLPVLTEKDVDDVVNFGVANGVDYVAASFVRTLEDVQLIRSTLDKAGGQRVRIISKIENQQGLDNYEAILEASDAIMIARGDLGMELPPEKLFIAQKHMIQRAALAGKPCICATQMLESMCGNPLPTRAECLDVANAVLDGASATTTLAFSEQRPLETAAATASSTAVAAFSATKA